MPAIDQSKGLRTPIPVADGMDRGVHRILHSVKIVHLAEQGIVVNTSYLRIKRPKNNRYSGTYSVHGLLAQVIEFGKDGWRDIPGGRTRLHLLVAALHGIGCALGGIIEDTCIKEPLITGPLAQREHDAHSLAMKLGYGALQQLALHDIAIAGAIA